MAIRFFNEDVDFALPNKKQTKNWLKEILQSEGFLVETINYIFCSDSHLFKINKEYLKHDTLTDIITFDYSDLPNTIESDIFISIERVRENAANLDKEFDEELHRVIIHGLLHILGYRDKTTEEKQEMREKEDACLSLR